MLTLFDILVHILNPTDQMVTNFITTPLLIVLKLHVQNLLEFSVFSSHAFYFPTLVSKFLN